MFPGYGPADGMIREYGMRLALFFLLLAGCIGFGRLATGGLLCLAWRDLFLRSRFRGHYYSCGRAGCDECYTR